MMMAQDLGLAAKSKGIKYLLVSFVDLFNGILRHAEALCAIFNPTVNSYKRIDAPKTLSKNIWSPNAVTYSGNNHIHMIRVPDQKRFELRLMDYSINPYFSQSCVLATGLDSIKNKLDTGKPVHLNMYKEGLKDKVVKKLPSTLLDTFRLFEKSKPINKALGKIFISSYIKLKLQEWYEYTSHLSDWEHRNILDC